MEGAEHLTSECPHHDHENRLEFYLCSGDKCPLEVMPFHTGNLFFSLVTFTHFALRCPSLTTQLYLYGSENRLIKRWGKFFQICIFFLIYLIFKLYFYNIDHCQVQYCLLDRSGRSCFCWCSANSQLHSGLFQFTVSQFVNKIWHKIILLYKAIWIYRWNKVYAINSIQNADMYWLCSKKQTKKCFHCLLNQASQIQPIRNQYVHYINFSQLNGKNLMGPCWGPVRVNQVVFQLYATSD